MVRSLFADASYLQRGIFALLFFALFFGTLFYSQSSVEIQAQQPVKAVAAEHVVAETPAPTAGDVFLELAATAGQTAPAKRLIDYKLKFDPSSRPRYWAVVDFDQPSTSKRLYVFDTVEKNVNTYYVSHGRGSEGVADDGMAETFSNQEGSFKSSLGIYRTLNAYTGQHGRSLRLEGLEATNSNALTRAIVMHTADYVSESVIRRTGRLGRSQGCFAVEKSVGNALIDQLKNGAYIVASRS